MVKPKILVADADARVLEAVKALGKRLGYDVVGTARGEDVVPLAVSHAPRLIVLDIKLPDADGRDLLQRIKRDVRASDIPVILCSKRDYESDRAIAIELGAVDYSPKDDMDLHSVLAKIEALLSALPRQAP